MKYEAGEQLRYFRFTNAPLEDTEENHAKWLDLKTGKKVEFSTKDAKALLGINIIQEVKEIIKPKKKGD